MGNMIIAIQTLNGIAIAVESPHLARPEETQNMQVLNQHTVIGYHETLPLGQQMFETILREQVNLDAYVVDIAEQATNLFGQFVIQEKIQSPIGFLFFGYEPKGQGAMLGWFHAGAQPRKAQFFPFCTSRPSPLVGYLVKKVYTPDMSLARALALAAYAMTQSRIVLAGQPIIIQSDRLNLAAIDPDRGFFWLDREATESIVNRNEKTDLRLRINSMGMFVEEN